MTLVMYGLGVMALGAILTYIAVSVCIRAKNKSVEKGFLTYWVSISYGRRSKRLAERY